MYCIHLSPDRAGLQRSERVDIFSGMLNLRRGLTLWMILAIVGCGPLRTRTAVPEVAVGEAAMAGLENVRYWADAADSGIDKSVVISWKQEAEAMQLPDPTQLPRAYTLAISGGGADGAYTAGLMNGWSVAGNRPEFKYVTGISTGALIAPFAFLGSKYDEQLKHFYTNVEDKDIAVFAGIINLFRGDAAFDTAPLKKLAAKCYTEELVNEVAAAHRKGRRLFVGSTNLDAQRPVIWDLGAIACSDHPDRVQIFRQVLLASAAIPGVFPPIYFHVKTADGQEFDEMHVDGGVTREMFLLPSQYDIEHVRRRHGIHRDGMSVYIIRNGPLSPRYQQTPARVGAIAGRSILTLIKSQSINDITMMYHEAKKQRWDFFLAAIPDDIKDESKSMFDRDHMKKLYDRGFAMAKEGYPWYRKPPFIYEHEPATIPAPTTDIAPPPATQAAN